MNAKTECHKAAVLGHGDEYHATSQVRGDIYTIEDLAYLVPEAQDASATAPGRRWYIHIKAVEYEEMILLALMQG